MNVRVIESPWRGRLLNMISRSNYILRIMVPYFTGDILNNILTVVPDNVKIEFLTRFSLSDIDMKSTDLSVLESIIRENIASVRACSNLHAKLIIIDDKMCVVTSSNLTEGGLEKNIEIGVILTGRYVKEVIDIFEKYWRAAEPITIEKMKKLIRATKRRQKNLEEKIKISTMIATIPPNGVDNPYEPSIPERAKRLVNKCLTSLRREYGDELIRSIVQFEKETRRLIKRKLGALMKKDISEILDLMNRDFRGSVRFGQAFIGRNRELILSNSIRTLNDLIKKAWFEDIQGLFNKSKGAKGIRTAFPSMLLYVRDPFKYNIWVPITENGIKLIFRLKSVKSIPLWKRYQVFNTFCNRLKEIFNIRPQELDVLLTLIGYNK